MPATARRRFITDFNDLIHHADIGLEGYTLRLGVEDRKPELATLRPGERVLGTDGMELWAEGQAALVVGSDGRRYWYIHRIATWHYMDAEPLPPGSPLPFGDPAPDPEPAG